MGEKEQRRDEIIEFLKQSRIDFQVRNNGWHIILHNDDRVRADLWPSTGKYRYQGKYGLGLYNLLAEMGLGRHVWEGLH